MVYLTLINIKFSIISFQEKLAVSQINIDYLFKFPDVVAVVSIVLVSLMNKDRRSGYFVLKFL